MKAVGIADLDRDRRRRAETDAARFKGIITMYEGMKPKDAAKVFDRLEMPVLFEIASQIAPRKMSDILGLMAAGGGRAADGRNGPPRRNGQIRRRRRIAQDRRQGTAAKVQLTGIFNKSLSRQF